MNHSNNMILILESFYFLGILRVSIKPYVFLAIITFTQKVFENSYFWNI